MKICPTTRSQVTPCSGSLLEHTPMRFVLRGMEAALWNKPRRSGVAMLTSEAAWLIALPCINRPGAQPLGLCTTGQRADLAAVSRHFRLSSRTLFAGRCWPHGVTAPCRSGSRCKSLHWRGDHREHPVVLFLRCRAQPVGAGRCGPTRARRWPAAPSQSAGRQRPVRLAVNVAVKTPKRPLFSRTAVRNLNLILR
jgi:hypothetical protein